MDKIICIGKNYAEHAAELGDAVPDKPVLFLKPPSVLVRAASPGTPIDVALPRGRGSVHHECEVVVRIGRDAERLSEQEAEAAIDGWTLGLDMTLRDVQTQLKKAGHPWEIGKVFAGSAILAPWLPASGVPKGDNFSLKINGTVKQHGNIDQMTLSPAACVAYASEYFPLRQGDLVFTGTPAGVGPVNPGDEAALAWGSRVLAKIRWV